MKRREWLGTMLGAAAGGFAAGCRSHSLLYRTSSGGLRKASDLPVSTAERKLLIVQFGGGTRNSETIFDPQHRFIPNLYEKLIPQGTLFTNMRVEHKVVHPNSTGSMMTGHWEWDNLDWSSPVAHPTLFEIYRKARKSEDTDTWAFVYASILANTGVSKAVGYGPCFAANVVEPPTIPRRTAERMNRIMLDAGTTGDHGAELDAVDECARLARTDAHISTTGLQSTLARTFLEEEFEHWRNGQSTTSHDAFLAHRAIRCMSRFSPGIIAVDFGEIDCAHYGSWSRYTEAILRTDELTRQLYNATRENDAYRDKTLMFVLPDHGRELDAPDRSGFVHHSDFYTNQGADEGCRRVWMLALGPGIAAGRTVETPIPITSVAATGLEYLGLHASSGAEDSLLPLTLEGNT